MKTRSPECRLFHVSRLLPLAGAVVLLAAPAARAAERDVAGAKPASPLNPAQWGTNSEWKVSGEFHDVEYDNLPLGDVVQHLQQLYDDQFDVLIPNSLPPSEPAPIDPNTGLPVPVEPLAARDLTVRLRLKNVTVPEVFRAMNMLFEMDRTPVRWDLVMFSNRPVAVLRPVEIQRPIPPPAPAAPPVPPTTGQAATVADQLAQQRQSALSAYRGVGAALLDQPVQRRVVYIGELIGDPGSGGMTMELVLKTLTATLEEGFSPARSKLQCHEAAELLIVTGPGEEVGFVTEVLSALQQKVSADRERKTRSSGVDSESNRP